MSAPVAAIACDPLAHLANAFVQLPLTGKRPAEEHASLAKQQRHGEFGAQRDRLFRPATGLVGLAPHEVDEAEAPSAPAPG